MREKVFVRKLFRFMLRPHLHEPQHGKSFARNGLLCRKAKYDDDGGITRAVRHAWILLGGWRAHWHVCFYCQHRRRLPLRLTFSPAFNMRCGFTPFWASIANLFSLRHSLPLLNMCNNAAGSCATPSAASLGWEETFTSLIAFLSSSKRFSVLRKVFCREQRRLGFPISFCQPGSEQRVDSSFYFCLPLYPRCAIIFHVSKAEGKEFYAQSGSFHYLKVSN